jgi:hypothetical protein
MPTQYFSRKRTIRANSSDYPRPRERKPESSRVITYNGISGERESRPHPAIKNSLRISMPRIMEYH